MCKAQPQGEQPQLQVPFSRMSVVFSERTWLNPEFTFLALRDILSLDSIIIVAFSFQFKEQEFKWQEGRLKSRNIKVISSSWYFYVTTASNNNSKGYT